METEEMDTDAEPSAPKRVEATLETFLSNPRAVDLVRELLALPTDPVRPPTVVVVPGTDPWFGRNVLRAFRHHAWTHVMLTDQRERDHSVYFRPDADHYIVTDLGEAAHAYRLRTSALHPDVPLNVHAQVITAASLHLHEGVLWGSFSAADLPPAIVAVLRASHHVASLPEATQTAR